MTVTTSIQRIIKHNTPKYNYVKLAEELAELQEVVLKRYVKKPENAPSIDRLIEEMSHVLLRMKIIAIQEDIQDKVNIGMSNKCEQLMEYISEGKYKNHI